MPDASALADPSPAPAAAGRAPATEAAKPAKTATKSGPQRALEKLGLLRPIDFALHLPLRYEDETRLVPIGALRDGQVALVEGEVRECRVEQRMRRMLVVRLADASGEVWLRFLTFYPSQQRALAAGARIRARGEVRGGFIGPELVHPSFRVVA